MHWPLVILLLAGIAVAVPALDRATGSAGQPDDDASATAGGTGRTVRVPADAQGHFVVQAVIGGRDIQLLADTGASAVVLTADDARRAGFNPASLDYSVPVDTAGGTSYTAEVALPRMEVAGIVVRDVRALVAKPEALRQSLLGMTFLTRLREFSVKDGTLVLVD